MEVRFYATLRPIVGGKTVDVEVDGPGSVRGLLETMSARWPALGELLWVQPGVLGDYIRVFVNGRDIRHLQQLETWLTGDESLDIFPPVAGGSGAG